MDRKDLIRASHVMPEIHDVWESRIQDLEIEREKLWTELRRATFNARRGKDPDIKHVSHDLERLDRSITFLDRALLHLDDVERGTKIAVHLPLRLDPPQRGRSSQTVK